MSTNTSIEWATKTWGPVLGCRKVSAGCDNCYAIRTAHRLAANPNPKVADAYAGLTERTEHGLDWTGVVRTLPERLQDPMKWRKPERIFVNSQSDLFHPAVGASFTARVFATMAQTPQHTYQVLTKRPDIALKILGSPAVRALITALAGNGTPLGEPLPRLPWPLPNVWIGVSVEDQKTADDRIPKLLQIPAAVRWISAEPLLGPIDLFPTDHSTHERDWDGGPGYRCLDCSTDDLDVEWTTWSGPAFLDWVVVGGESGPGARAMHPDWARSLRDQCSAAGVPMLFKQWGNWAPVDSADSRLADQWVNPDGSTVGAVVAHAGNVRPTAALVSRVGKKAAGRKLDGVTHDAYPQAVTS